MSTALDDDDDGAERRSRWAFERLWVQAGTVLAAWLLLLFLESLVVALLFRVEFTGSWETRAARRVVIPIALGALAPLSVVVAGLARLAGERRRWLAALALAAGGATGWGVTYGRHFANLAVRAPFVALVAVAAAGVVWLLAPRLAAAAETHPRIFGIFGLAVSALAWAGDASLLPRLYPAFHAALCALTLLAGAAAALLLRPAPGEDTRGPGILALCSLLVGLCCVAYAPRAASLLRGSDNLRMILVEHAPLEGRAVWLASWLAPPPADDDTPADGSPAVPNPGELPRALDWTGHDIVLVTVDALRADHVSSYGYGRATTPNLDALAATGARFDAAYCPTPHTSYSITSLMTGKYMRPLVALGLGDDSDTWAGLLRRYGYRTAAFYPPAVFFIDGDRFRAMHDRGLDFEYRKEEFASPSLRATEVGDYLATAPTDKPLFVWVHFFEPHEPYVAHAEHPFGERDIDRYDSEIAAADDGIGAVVREVRRARPGAVVLVTADHGEEFGEHGGRYHGTTVYEEQVRVPLVIDGPGVAPEVAASVVQTIDLLPTVLSALGIPRPARLRGRDLGPVIAPKPHAAADPGLAFAETDEYTLLARGDSRLVCGRRAAACALYDRARDPGETHDVASERPIEVRDLRRVLGTIASEQGRFEHGEEASWPEALRRGIAGDGDAAVDVAALLDDASVRVRTKAAEVSFDLHAGAVAPAMRRAAASHGDEGTDAGVRRWCALALVRMGEPPTALAESLLRDPDVAWRRPAALAFAEQGDARGADDLAAWWKDRGAMDYVRATEVLAAIGHIRDKAAVPSLVQSLADVRLRPFVADTLGAVGGASAREPLAAALAAEPQVTTRTHEARALAALGGAAWSGEPTTHLDVKFANPGFANPGFANPGFAKPLRLAVLGGGDAVCKATLAGVELTPSEAITTPLFDVPAAAANQPRIAVSLDDPAGVKAVFLLRAPPPPSRRADAGAAGVAGAEDPSTEPK